MIALTDGIIRVNAARSVQPFSTNGPIKPATDRPLAGKAVGRTTIADGVSHRVSGAARLGETAARSSSPGRASLTEGTGPSSAYLAMVLNNLRSTLQMAEAFRQTVAAAEPPVAYARFASQVYALEVRAQQEISRLRSEGLTTLRQWFA